MEVEKCDYVQKLYTFRLRGCTFTSKLHYSDWISPRSSSASRRFSCHWEQAVPPLYYCKKQNDKYAVFIRFEATHVSILAANYMDLLLVATTAAALGRLLDATHKPKQNYSLWHGEACSHYIFGLELKGQAPTRIYSFGSKSKINNNPWRTQPYGFWGNQYICMGRKSHRALRKYMTLYIFN